MLQKVDCLPNAVGKQPVHTLDLSWKKMDVKLMMMMMMMKVIIHYLYAFFKCSCSIQAQFAF